MNVHACKPLALLLGITLVASVSAQVRAIESQEHNGRVVRSTGAKPTGRIIVKWRTAAMRATTGLRAQKASNIARVALKHATELTDDLEVLEADTQISPSAIEAAVEQLGRDPDVEYASLEYRRNAHALTSDPLLLNQWYLLSDQPAATRTDVAWDTTQSNSAVIVAVLDTGVRFNHPDLGRVSDPVVPVGKLFDGYDFVSNPTIANDGGGRDADASDPGDWVTVAEAQSAPFDEDCLTEDGSAVDSSWHGTRVASLIAARTDNAAGIAGNAWNSRILPVRVLGKCGGTDTDIIAGIRWAAGLTVAGVPINTNPAKVINLSLGGEGACTSVYQATIDAVIAAGSLVVASAGNEGGGVNAPANCVGVLGVAGVRHIGTKVGFSSLGPEVGISAPGGNCVNTAGGPCLFSIVVATNDGTTAPGTNTYTDQLNYNIGTSFSAPMASSAAALLRSVNNTLTPPQIVLLLKDAATPFPNATAPPVCQNPSDAPAIQNFECGCTTETCGAGLLNTGAAIAAATRPLAVVQTTGAVSVGATINVSGASSFATQGRTIAAYQWSIVTFTGATPTIANPNQSTTTLTIPAATQFTLRLTVTDDQGTQDTKDTLLATPAALPPVTPAPAPPVPAPAPTAPTMSNGGGGGGQFGFELLALALIGAVRRARRLQR